MNKFKYFLMLFLMNGSPTVVSAQTDCGAKAELKSEVRKDPATSSYLYTYHLFNRSTDRRLIERFGLHIYSAKIEGTIPKEWGLFDARFRAEDTEIAFVKYPREGLPPGAQVMFQL